MKKNIIDMAKIFKALGEPIRLEIVQKICLCKCTKCACDLGEGLEISQSTLSHHMKILTTSGVLKSFKDKNFVRYQLNEGIQNLLEDIIDNSEEKACKNCC